jgi:hypothetical protein
MKRGEEDGGQDKHHSLPVAVPRALEELAHEVSATKVSGLLLLSQRLAAAPNYFGPIPF